MLYVFGGNKNSRSSMRSALESLQKRAPLADVMRITNENSATVSYSDLLAAQGLFYAKRIVVFDNAFGEKIAQEILFSHTKEMAQSEHVFLILEETPSAALKTQLVKHATKAVMGDGEKKQKEQADWSATNALEARDGERLWRFLHISFLKGIAPEQVHGQLFWKAKQLLLERRFRSFKEEELKNMVGILAELPQSARRSGMDMEYALELFALRM